MAFEVGVRLCLETFSCTYLLGESEQLAFSRGNGLPELELELHFFVVLEEDVQLVSVLLPIELQGVSGGAPLCSADGAPSAEEGERISRISGWRPF